MGKDRLRIMIVDDHDSRAEALALVLGESGYDVVDRVGTESYLPDRVREILPDLILIDVDAPERDTLEQLGVIQQQLPRPVVMLSRTDDRGVIEQAIRAGVCAYVVEGLHLRRVRPVIDSAIATFERFELLRTELEKTKSTLSDRKIIDCAKGILMARRSLPEPDAYKMMQKMAMDRKRKLVEIAQDVIEMSDLFAAGTPGRPS